MNHANVISSESRTEKTKNEGIVVEHTLTKTPAPRRTESVAHVANYTILPAFAEQTLPSRRNMSSMHQHPVDEDEYVYTVGRDKQLICKVTIDGKQVEMLVDSGASVDLIDDKTFSEPYNDKKRAPDKTNRRIFSYGSPMPLPLMGTIQAELSANTNSTHRTLHIVKGASGNILGYNTAKQLGVLKIINQLKTDETQFPANRRIRKSLCRNRQSNGKSNQASHRP